MIPILEYSDRKFKITLINMFIAQMVGSMRDRVVNIKRKMKILTKNWKKMLKISLKKKKVTEIKECLWCNHELTGKWWRKNQWAWIKIDRNILNWNSKSKKNEKRKRKEKQLNIPELQKIFKNKWVTCIIELLADQKEKKEKYLN